MQCISIYSNLLKFLSALFYSFQCRSLMSLLSLFLNIFLFFLLLRMVLFPYFQFLDCSLLVNKNAINLCILILYPMTLLKLLVLVVVFVTVSEFSTSWIMLSENTVLLLPFQPECFLFVFLALLH